MREIVELFFSLAEGFFEFNSNDEKNTQKVKRIIKGIVIFLICMAILIAYIVFSNKSFDSQTIMR